MVLIADHPAAAPVVGLPDLDEAAARRTMRDQIARIEGELSALVASAFPGPDAASMTWAGPRATDAAARGAPRLLDLGELERLRDALAERLHAARGQMYRRGEREREARLALERMLAEPRRHRFLRIARADLGVPGCGFYEVRPRLGLVGLLAGWWHVKLSSGCPLPGRGEPASCPASPVQVSGTMVRIAALGRTRVLQPWAAAAASAPSFTPARGRRR